MKNMPTVSVIIPTYNRAHLVGRAIKSVLDQTFTDLELIVVDDGSTDNTEKAVRSFQDIRIRYIRHKMSRGQSAARNTGIKEARGEYIAFLDDDDEWLPQKLERQLEVFARTKIANLGVVTSGRIIVSEDGTFEIERSIFNFRDDVYESLLNLQWVPAPTTLLIRRECLDDNIFDENIPNREDWDLCVRLSKRYQFDSIIEPLVRMYKHSGARASAPPAPWRCWLYGIQKYEGELRKRPRAYAKHRYFAFLGYCKVGHLVAARAELFGSLLLDPWQPKLWAILLILFVGPKFTRMKRLYHAYLKKNSINRAETKEINQDAERKLCGLAAQASKLSLWRGIIILIQAVRLDPRLLWWGTSLKLRKYSNWLVKRY